MSSSNGQRWIRENTFGGRYRFWTRANVSEVLPEPPSPLGWDLAWEGAIIAGWRDLFVHRCGMGEDELDAERAEMIGIFGGYAYLGAAFFRVWAGRTPGMKPTTIDEVYFGDHPDVPPYVAEPWHTNAATTARMEQWLAWATVGRDQSELEADREVSLQLRRDRPDFATMTEHQLIGHAVGLRPHLRRMFNQHINQSLAASVGPGVLAGVCEAVGRPDVAMRLFTGLTGVDSAAPSYAMWELSRLVRSSRSLTSLFDGGVAGLRGRLAAGADDDGDARAFLDGLAAFLAEFGSRGVNEWDLASRTWELAPDSVLVAVDRMRLAGDEASPGAETSKREAERTRLAGEVRALLGDDAESVGAFDMALASAATFIAGRERAKTSIIRVVHEARMATTELGRRFAARGTLDAAEDVYMFFMDELGALADGTFPDAAAVGRQRQAHRRGLAAVEPPFIIAAAPDPSRWPRRGDVRRPALAVGESITGVAGCPGTARGRARVVLGPDEATDLEPGDILVAPVTDPAWTPLFVPAGGAVVEVGAALSHAIIVSRELGIPCAVSVVDATKRIPDGAIVDVDGGTGTVTLVALP